MAKEKSLIEKVEWIRTTDKISDYQIAKDTGIAYSAVYRFRQNKSKIENITLGAAMKYAILYDAINKK
jgi:hypothetical protein